MRRITPEAKQCELCATSFNRSEFPLGGRETMKRYRTRKYCSHVCYRLLKDRPFRKDIVAHVSYLDRARKYRKTYCESCGIISGEEKRDVLAIHHVDFNRSNNLPNNLQTLCCSCHASLHSRLKRTGR